MKRLFSLIITCLLILSSMHIVYGESETYDSFIWSYNNGTLSISATSDTKIDFDYSNPYPWYKYYSQATTLVIGDHITSIDYSVFTICKNLTTINLSQGTNNPYFSVSNGVLFNKDKSTLLRYLPKNTASVYKVPTSVKTIDNCAFLNVSSSTLKTIVLPKGIKTIERSNFGDGFEMAYAGSKAQWENVSVSSYFNNDLLYRTIQFNYTGLAVDSIYTKTLTVGSTLSISAKAAGNTKITYKSSNKKIGTVSKSGVVKAKAAGPLTITITSAKSKYYAKKTKKIKLKVIPAATRITKLGFGGTTYSYRMVWNKVKGISGYQVQFSTSSNFSKNTKAKNFKASATSTKELVGFKKGKKYYIRIRTFKTYKKKKYYSNWSSSIYIKFINGKHLRYGFN